MAEEDSMTTKTRPPPTARQVHAWTALAVVVILLGDFALFLLVARTAWGTGP